MIPDVGEAMLAKRIRNPGRRGIAADLYIFPIRMQLETALRGHREYRALRYEFDRLERKLQILSRSGYPESRLSALQSKILQAGNACATYMIKHLPASEPEVPVVLTRELDADGSLVSESETPVDGAP